VFPFVILGSSLAGYTSRLVPITITKSERRICDIDAFQLSSGNPSPNNTIFGRRLPPQCLQLSLFRNCSSVTSHEQLAQRNERIDPWSSYTSWFPAAM